MLCRSIRCFRYRTAWRELLHPLPVWAREDQWLKRDTVELNEAVLRQPYCTLKNHAQPTLVIREEDGLGMQGSSSSSSRAVNHTIARSQAHPQYTAQQQQRHRYVPSQQARAALRDQLVFPSVIGPPSPADVNRGAYTEEYGHRLRPRYPQSWDTVPPHQPSRVV